MAIDVINCKRCGKLFQRVTSKKLCPECLRELEEKFNEVKGYIKRTSRYYNHGSFYRK